MIWIRLACSADGIADDGISNDPEADQYVAATLVTWEYALQGFDSVASTRPNKSEGSVQRSGGAMCHFTFESDSRHSCGAKAGTAEAALAISGTRRLPRTS